jgi:hypothetical protein
MDYGTAALADCRIDSDRRALLHDFLSDQIIVQ